MRTSASTTRLHRTPKKLELTLKGLKFSAEDPIFILDFLCHLFEEVDTLHMSEGQLIVCFPHMLSKTTAREYRSNASINRASGLSY